MVETEKIEKNLFDKNMPFNDETPYSVIYPENNKDVLEALLWANKEKIKVIPRGSMSSLSGGSKAVKDSLVIDFSKMNKIIEMDTHDLVLTVEPGTKLKDIYSEVEGSGFYFPIDSFSSYNGTAGGAAGENYQGMRFAKYSDTRLNTMQIEVVNPVHGIVTLGGKTVKNVSGYDAKIAWIGSEGTLGIFTKLMYKLLPLPEKRSIIILPFESVDEFFSFKREFDSLKVFASALDFMSNKIANYILKVDSKYSAFILIEGRELEVERLKQEILKFGKSSEAQIFEGKDFTFMYENRLSMGSRSLNDKLFADDVTLPIKSCPSFLKYLEGKNYDFLLHAQDGGMLVFRERIPLANDEIYKIVLDQKGSLIAERQLGIQPKRKLFLEKSGKVYVELMNSLKKSVDPNFILSPDRYVF
ncbi:D-lactate dehydrogenase (cytochrome) [Thermodesulfobium narugense DSM 14796]|uniref:D-lactate dehydrogenase (cytochrome) n=1 Tax=Thermodesulfobium narugense DSM 14796 TaxID=747365 RepID=M1E5E8_9BACT|nr:FAD-binding oxidoreductase [Thermodesulfobium narugense]AEE15042.1 D-lactate dehydrogenase (cytochrome) [Thermodesulfobium narugense DSM 14796]